MVNDRKKSDESVRALRSANNGGKPPAESAEQRDSTKENPGSRATRRTQCRESVPPAADRILPGGVRGEHHPAGEFRTSQNRAGGGLSDAIFVPSSLDHVPGLMDDLEKFIHNTDLTLPALVRIGIAYCQFETIHPFPDGNGRIGRLLIVLLLLSEGVVHRPLLSLSGCLAKDRGLYDDSLMRVRTSEDAGQGHRAEIEDRAADSRTFRQTGSRSLWGEFPPGKRTGGPGVRARHPERGHGQEPQQAVRL